MGTSSSNTSSAPDSRAMASLGFLNHAMACSKGKGKERVDAASPSQDNPAWLPPTCNYNPCLGFNFTSLVMSMTEPAEGGDNSIQAFRNFSVTDIVRFVEKRYEELCTIHRLQIATLTDEHQQQMTEIESRSTSEVQELLLSLERVSKELFDAEARLSRTTTSLTATESLLQVRNMAAHTMQGELDKEKALNVSLYKYQDDILKEMNAMKVDLESKLSHSLKAEQAKDREVHRLNNIILEKDTAIGEQESATKLLFSDREKLKAQLTTIELKSAQESSASGSYAEDQANPAMLETACQSVDRAMDNLTRFLHAKSITSTHSLKGPELEQFISAFSRAKPAEFTRPAHLRHVWGHWICAKMFQGFEHVFFDVGEERTSPLDSRKHATECFRRFQDMKSISPSDFNQASDLFRNFCAKMYSLVLSSDLVNNELLDLFRGSSKMISCDRNGRCDGDEELYNLFLEVAKAIWLLHELAFSFDPSASILRFGWGEPFDTQYHESLIKDAESEVMSSKVVLMTRPGFRVKNTTVKGRVFLSKQP